MSDHFLSALSFLSRLWPPRMVKDEDFPKCLVWFPLVGLVVGTAAILPAYLGLFKAQPWLQGWLVTGLSLWLTRGLHADGLADIADAWGSGARGDRFWAIMKDSRSGPFGVLVLVMALAGQILAFGALAGQGKLWEVCWCLVLGRVTSVVALGMCRGLVRPGLSALFASGAGKRTQLSVLAQTVALGSFLLTPSELFLGLAGALIVTLFLWRLAKKQKGFNGDFMGAAIVLGELAGALALLA